MINQKLHKEICDINKKIDKEITEKEIAFKKAFNYEAKKLFKEIAFCILTPQSKALMAWDIIEQISANNLLYEGDENELVPYLKRVRFCNTKAKRLCMLRNLLTVDGELNPKKVMFEGKDVLETRKWILDNVVGMGLKEASHLLRNLGFGEDIAILDRHILRCLKDLNVITEIPKTMTYKKYLEIEEEMKKYSIYSGISMGRLDFVLWYRQIGYIFK